MLRKLRDEGSHCTPDGLLKRDGAFYLWEAMNYIQPLYASPFEVLVWEWAWLLARTVTYRKIDYKLSGFVISWWSPEPDPSKVLDEVGSMIDPLTVEIIYTKDVLADCIRDRPSWYIEIVERKRSEVLEFFEGLLGRRQLN